MKLSVLLIISLLISKSSHACDVMGYRVSRDAEPIKIIKEMHPIDQRVIANKIYIYNAQASTDLNQEGLAYVPLSAQKIFNNGFRRVSGNSKRESVLSTDEKINWMSEYVGMPSVLYDACVFKMWFVGDHGNYPGNSSIGYAESIDGINWKLKNDGNPVFKPNNEIYYFDSQFVSHPNVVKMGAQYWMWY
jgi:hypothetical protein